MPSVRLEVQFSVFLVNKPGVLAQVTRALADSKVNVVAMTLVDSQEHGVLRVVTSEAAKARAALSKLNLPMTETDVLCVELSNRPGALADVPHLMGVNHININYAYATSGAVASPMPEVAPVTTNTLLVAEASICVPFGAHHSAAARFCQMFYTVVSNK